MTGIQEAPRTEPVARPGSRSISVRVRILITILVVSAVGLAGTGAASYLVQRQRALATVDTQLSNTVAALKAVTEGADSSGSSVSDVLRTAMERLVPPENQAVC